MNYSQSNAVCKTLADPLEVFELRCQVRAYLWSQGDYDLHTAVDELQYFAERQGLVYRVGQDHLQAVINREFGKYDRSREYDVVPS